PSASGKTSTISSRTGAWTNDGNAMECGAARCGLRRVAESRRADIQLGVTQWGRGVSGLKTRPTPGRVASERRERATRTERAGEAVRERACRGVRGAKPLD